MQVMRLLCVPLQAGMQACGSVPCACEPEARPRQVYGWFLGLYKVSVAAGLGGYLLLVLEVFGVGLLLRPAGIPATLSLLLVWCARPPVRIATAPPPLCRCTAQLSPCCWSAASQIYCCVGRSLVT